SNLQPRQSWPTPAHTISDKSFPVSPRSYSLSPPGSPKASVRNNGFPRLSHRKKDHPYHTRGPLPISPLFPFQLVPDVFECPSTNLSISTIPDPDLLVGLSE